MYLLPSLLTIGNMMLGFFAVVQAYRGSQALDLAAADRFFGLAALAIFAAGVLDMSDGRIARATGTTSEFGKEYDSLADLFTFGVTPAVILFLWGLESQGKVGWLVPFFYLVCTATRLARFNVSVKSVDTRYFVGLPSPAAAGAVVFPLFFNPGPDWREEWIVGYLFLLPLVGALEMSTFRYPSPKQIDFGRRMSYRVAIPILAVILLIVWKHEITLVVMAATYLLSGPVMWLVHRFRRPTGDEDAPTSHGDDSAAPPLTAEPGDDTP
jgi:CDP-diacylglycerol--serine O-phosphatidyltransferase